MITTAARPILQCPFLHLSSFSLVSIAFRPLRFRYLHPIPRHSSLVLALCSDLVRATSFEDELLPEYLHYLLHHCTVSSVPYTQRPMSRTALAANCFFALENPATGHWLGRIV